jgi:DNA polymerase (family X)
MGPSDAALIRDNAAVADMLRDMAALLEAQGETNPFRVAAYRHAADTVAALPSSVRELFEREGLAGLDALPTIGPGIAAAIGEIVRTGRWMRLDRLRGASGPEAVFRTIPGVGVALALRLHDELGVETLEALEVGRIDPCGADADARPLAGPASPERASAGAGRAVGEAPAGCGSRVPRWC